MHPWIFTGEGQASVNFMSSTTNDISLKSKDYAAWIAYTKEAFVNTDDTGLASFD